MTQSIRQSIAAIRTNRPVLVQSAPYHEPDPGLLAVTFTMYRLQLRRAFGRARVA